MSLDQTIKYLLELAEEKKKKEESQKRPDLLEAVFGSVPGLSIDKLYQERRRDQERARGKYHT